jgi:hypothetical protein
VVVLMHSSEEERQEKRPTASVLGTE